MGRRIVIHDPTLRDGSHAIHHQLTEDMIRSYATLADQAGVDVIEVGHGNGVGASSLQVGESLLSDSKILSIARSSIKNAKLGIHCIPSFATINKDLVPAIDLGVELVRVASHCTEADLCQRHIEYLSNRGVEVHGTLMMASHTTPDILVAEAQKLESYGAQAVIVMDSAGSFLPKDVAERIGLLVEHLTIPVGFHAHNNLGLAVANAVEAAHSGATIIDGTAAGFGAGAGNTPLEVIVAVLSKIGFETNVNLYKILDLSDHAYEHLLQTIPVPRSQNIVSGLTGVFSGFSKHINRIALQYGVDEKDVYFALGKRKVIAGQEDLIIEVAAGLANQKLEKFG